MATTFLKRSKEKLRQEKQQDKAQDRQQRKAVRKEAPPREAGEDPDIAHIVPGPQPLPPEFE
jgi:hypothetical protein